MNIYEARWNNAKKLTEKLNKWMDQGYIIFDENDEKVKYKFTITENRIYLQISENAIQSYFENNPDFDDGSNTKIADYNKQFKDWKAILPSQYQGVL